MSLSERLAELISKEYRSEREFAREIGLNPKTVNNIVNNQNSPNHSVVAKILKAIPRLSAEWLTRGEGPMWRDDVKNDVTSKSKQEEIKITDLTIGELMELINKEKKG